MHRVRIPAPHPATCALADAARLPTCLAGLANAFVAHAQTRLADAYLAEWSQQLSLPASNMAREEYAHAHALYTALLEKGPTRYSPTRQKSVHAVAVGQRMRPIPLRLDVEDARSADMGLGV